MPSQTTLLITGQSSHALGTKLPLRNVDIFEMNLRTYFYAGVCALSFGLISTAGFAQTYTLHFKPKTGKSLYSMKMNTSTGAQKVLMQGVLSMTYAPAPKGQHQVSMGFESIAMSLNGKPMPASTTDMLAKMHPTMLLDQSGAPVKGSATGMMGMETMLGGFGQGLFNRPLHVGQKLTADTQSAGTTASAVYVFKGVKTVGSRKVAIFEISSLSSPSAQTKLLGHPTLMLDYKTGQLVSTVLKMETTASNLHGTTSVMLKLK